MRHRQKNDLVSHFIETLESDSKYFEFEQRGLRGGNEIYKRGGHVTNVKKDRVFSMLYDNRRRIKDLEDNRLELPSEVIEEIRNHEGDVSDVISILMRAKEAGYGRDGLLDSDPLVDKDEGLLLRGVSKIFKPIYNQMSSKRLDVKTISTRLMAAVRAFLKGILHEPPMYGLPRFEDAFDDYKSAVDFIHGFDSSLSLSKSSISHLRNRKMIIRSVEKSDITEGFAVYIQGRFPDFRPDEFFEKKKSFKGKGGVNA